MGRQRLVLAGGGTGGHLFPGLAVAKRWQSHAPESREVVVLGTGRSVERRAVPAAGFELRLVRAKPLKGKRLADRVLSLVSLPISFAEATFVLLRLRPKAVLGLGGYVSGPVVVAARALGIPTALLEQNSVPGITNRLLAKTKAVSRAYISFASSAGFFSAPTVRHLGNPVRESIVAVSGTPLPKDPTVFVLGGSQGARSINLALPHTLASVRKTVPGLKVRHQTGEAMASQVKDAYKQLGLDDVARVEPFVDDMAAAYKGASLLVCRAGATTLAEVTVTGRPSVLIPFPHAADDHQRKNAEELERAGAGIVVADHDTTEDMLAPKITELLLSPERLRTMSQKAMDLGKPNATEDVTDDLEELIRVSR